MFSFVRVDEQLTYLKVWAKTIYIIREFHLYTCCYCINYGNKSML